MAHLDGLMRVGGFLSRSETIRHALREASGLPAVPFTPDQLVRRLHLRHASIAARPIAEDEVLLTRTELSGVQPSLVEEKLLPALRELIHDHVRTHGWFFPSTNQQVVEVLAEVQKHRVRGPHYSGMGRIGVDFLRARFPSFWSTWRGPVDSTRDRDRFDLVLRHLLGLSAASRPQSVSWPSVRRELMAQHMAVSFFRPAVAAGIYTRWLGSNPRPKVWDPSSGFGARMLGFFSSYPNGTYCGSEPARLTFHDLTLLGREMPGEVRLDPHGSEFAAWTEGELDFVFTSPPYFNLEKYFDEPGQCWVEYPTIELWRDQYITPTMQASFNGLKAGGFAIFNINSTHRATLILAAQATGFVLHAEEKLLLRRDHFSRRASINTSGRKHEPILVFRKPG